MELTIDIEKNKNSTSYVREHLSSIEVDLGRCSVAESICFVRR